MNIREKLIKNGIINLKEFGYPDVDEKNILTDMIYSAFFKSMLEDNLEKGYDTEIKSLINEIEKSNTNKERI